MRERAISWLEIHESLVRVRKQRFNKLSPSFRNSIDWHFVHGRLQHVKWSQFQLLQCRLKVFGKLSSGKFYKVQRISALTIRRAEVNPAMTVSNVASHAVLIKEPFTALIA